MFQLSSISPVPVLQSLSLLCLISLNADLVCWFLPVALLDQPLFSQLLLGKPGKPAVAGFQKWQFEFSVVLQSEGAEFHFSTKLKLKLWDSNPDSSL